MLLNPAIQAIFIILKCVAHDLDFDEDDAEDYAGGFKEDGNSILDKDDDFEDGCSVESFTSGGSIKHPETLQKGLGDHIVYLWGKCKSQLISGQLCHSWMDGISVVPHEIMLDAKSYNHRERE
jgi:hypothetical protein